jgi:hypothetical protein
LFELLILSVLGWSTTIKIPRTATTINPHLRANFKAIQ